MSVSQHMDRRSGQMPPPVMEELAPTVFAYVQLDGSWGLNNCGVLLGSRGVTLVDTTFTEARSRALREELAKLSAQPVRTLLNTHHHGDHTYGNFLFPGASIIAHERCREAMLATGLETTKYFPGVDWGEIEIEAPFVTFQDRLRIYVDDLQVEARFVGPAHTTNDIIGWLPEQRILFAGDLVFNGGTPFVVMGSVEGSLRSLELMRGLGAERVLPGHGAPCGPEVIDEQVSYLRFVQEQARRGWQEQVPPLELARQIDLGPYSEWHDAERLVGNIHRAYAEFDGLPLGTPLNFDAIVDEMVAYNGRAPLRCLA